MVFLMKLRMLSTFFNTKLLVNLFSTRTCILFCKAALNPANLQHELLHGVIPAQGRKDPAFSFVEFPEIPIGSFL